jgi:hypothetical protein
MKSIKYPSAQHQLCLHEGKRFAFGMKSIKHPSAPHQHCLHEGKISCSKPHLFLVLSCFLFGEFSRRKIIILPRCDASSELLSFSINENHKMPQNVRPHIAQTE